MPRFSPDEIIAREYVTMMTIQEVKEACSESQVIPQRILDKMVAYDNMDSLKDVLEACREAWCEYQDDARFQDMAYGPRDAF